MIFTEILTSKIVTKVSHMWSQNPFIISTGDINNTQMGSDKLVEIIGNLLSLYQ